MSTRRKIHFGQSKADRQADYLARFSDALLTRAPRLAGRIDWPSAQHYFFSGTPVEDAVNSYLIARNVDA